MLPSVLPPAGPHELPSSLEDSCIRLRATRQGEERAGRGRGLAVAAGRRRSQQLPAAPATWSSCSDRLPGRRPWQQPQGRGSLGGHRGLTAAGRGLALVLLRPRGAAKVTGLGLTSLPSGRGSMLGSRAQQPADGNHPPLLDPKVCWGPQRATLEQGRAASALCLRARPTDMCVLHQLQMVLFTNWKPHFHVRAVHVTIMISEFSWL